MMKKHLDARENDPHLREEFRKMQMRSDVRKEGEDMLERYKERIDRSIDQCNLHYLLNALDEGQLQLKSYLNKHGDSLPEKKVREIRGMIDILKSRDMVRRFSKLCDCRNRAEYKVGCSDPFGPQLDPRRGVFR